MSYVACAKSKCDCDVIMNKFLRFSVLKSKNRYIVFKNYSIKLQFSSEKCTFKAIFRFKISLHAVFLQFFTLMYKDVITATQNI